VTEFLPFKGIYYNNKVIKGDDVLAPPYDIISPRKKESLYARSDYNIVRIDFGKDHESDTEGENRYTRARESLERWQAEGILLKHPTEAYYIYETAYTYGGVQRRLRGLVGALKLVDLGKGVFPHEETHSAPKLDRLNIMRYCKANVSPIFSIYRSEGHRTGAIIDRISAGPPYLEATDDSEDIHRMWIVDEKQDIESIRDEISGCSVFIADGHHRYETAIAYRDEMRETKGSGEGCGSDFVMMFLANMSDPGITILPTHRLVNDVPPNIVELLSGHFTVRSIGRAEDLVSEMAKQEHAIGLFSGKDSGAYILTPKDIDLRDMPSLLRDLDVTVLHKLVFKKLFNTDIITYEMDPARCVEEVREGRFEAAFFLNPTRVSDIERVALGGLRMPPKSTYFYPKLLTGFVINPFE